MTQYLMSVWHDDDYELDFSGDDMQRRVAQVDRFNEDLTTAGAWVFAGGLHPASSATVLRPNATGVTMTDGPRRGQGADRRILGDRGHRHGRRAGLGPQGSARL